MKTIQVELPDKLAAEVEALVGTGWFGSEGELVRAALLEFIRRNRADLVEGFLREDIQWALSQKDQAA
ncbi:MAG: CopG family transcriptional regulator [Zetaproteobacteria bacterium]|nr:MAG: CopG family transcriptional regulator [Zetaproteobacteria bacterium]